MSKVCDLCAKGPKAGNTVSHSVRRVKRRFLPNLIKVNLEGKKIKICTQCQRTQNKAHPGKKGKKISVTSAA